MASDSSTEPSALAIRRVTHDKILLFGDSITELSSDILSLTFAITPALQQHYFRKLSIVARGYGGYTTDHLRHVLVPTLRAETAAKEKIKLLVLEIGTNDAADSDMVFVPLARYTENLRWMVDTARAEGVERVIIVGPGPVDDAMLAPPIDKSTTRNLEYSEAARAVAKKAGIPFICLWHAFLASKGWQEGQPVPGAHGVSGEGLKGLLTDGVHYTGDGYRIWYNQLLEAIRTNFPDLRTEELPTILPHIFDVDRGNLPDTLWQEVEVKR